MTEFMKKYKLKITVLSPVHIGAATDLEPTEYVIYSEKGKAELSQKQTDSTVICTVCGHKNPANAEYCGSCDCELPRQAAPVRQTTAQTAADSYLYTFTPGQLSDALSDADKTLLLKEAKKGDLMALQNFFKNKAAAIVKTARKRAFVCPEVAKKYDEKFGRTNSGNNEFNQFIIERQISDPVTGLPYIPGSSIKGAIRTALMSAKNKFSSLNRQNFIRCNNKNGKSSAVKNAGSIAEKQLYGYDVAPAQDAPDPFKALKLCDAVSNSDLLTKIRPAQRTGKKGDIPSNIEIIPENASFVSSLSIMQDVKPVNFGETIETIRAACNDFYLDVLKNEINEKWDENIDAIIKALEKKAAASNVFILNLGKNSGAESKTVKGLRIIENRQQHTLMERSVTYWFANDGRERLPFGWCVVEFEEEK